MSDLWPPSDRSVSPIPKGEDRLSPSITTGTHMFSPSGQRYAYRVLQTIQMKLLLLCVWAERAVVGSTKTTLKFKYEIQIG